MPKKILSIFLLIVLAGRISIADEDKYSFTSVKAGEEVPYSGYLMKPEALVKIYTDSEETERRLKLQCNSKTDLLKLDIKKITESKDMQRRELSNRYESILKQKKELIESQQKEINNLNDKVSFDMLWIAVSFVAGVGVMYGVTQLILGSQ